MELFYSSGLRLAELVGLDLADLDLGDRTVRVLGKGSKTRIVPVGRQARRRRSRDWLKERAELAPHGETALFVGRNGGASAAAPSSCASSHWARRQGAAPARAPAPVPPFVRHAPARIEQDLRARAGAARPRDIVHDADLHAP